MKKTIFFTILLVAAIWIQAIAQDDEKGWIKLADKTVSFKAETDNVNLTGKKQNLSKIKIKCTHGTVKLKAIRVEMSDGTKKEYDAKGVGVLTKGMSSLAYDLPGKDTKLKKLEIDYDAVGNMLVTDKGKVEILGKERKEKDKD